jgi:predicted ATPase
LPRQQAVEVILQVAHGKTLPPEVVEQIVAKTDGVPLFIEELTKMGLESGLLQEREERYELTGPLPPLAIPATLHDSLMARLDRLAAVKGLAQLGATLGREFSYELLQAVSLWDEAILQRGLQQLVEAEFLYQQGLPPQATYVFKHALIQEAAYQSLLRSTRQQYHQRIAQVLEAQFSEIAATQPEVLAHHYTEAGLHAQAVGYWHQAGQRTTQRSAYQAYSRVRELCQEVGDTPQLPQVLWGLWFYYHVRAEFRIALEQAASLLTLAQRKQDPVLHLQAHLALGFDYFHLGELGRAQAHLDQGIAFYDPQQHRTQALLYGQDLGVLCQGYTRPLWSLGYPEQACKRGYAAMTLAEELQHPFSLAFALNWLATVSQFRREVQVTYEWAERLVALCTEQGFELWVPFATVLRGWALAQQGQCAEGIAQMQQGTAAWRATGAEVDQPYFLTLLAEAYGQAGQVDNALALLAEALVVAHEYDDMYWVPEVYRLKGELLLSQGLPHEREAETCLHQALALARRQQAKSLELRAAMSLARLWQRQGKRDEARELLAPIYDWFTEGFDTADLQEAKALLEELG